VERQGYAARIGPLLARGDGRSAPLGLSLRYLESYPGEFEGYRHTDPTLAEAFGAGTGRAEDQPPQ